MNGFIEMNYQDGLITNDDLQMYLEAGMIDQDFYNQLTSSNTTNTQSSSVSNSSGAPASAVSAKSNSFNPVQ